MNPAGEILNKVASSGLVVLELDSFLPSDKITAIDIADQLWEGMALREKDFRAFIISTDWTAYQGQIVAVFCSADAIIPHWAYMLIASQLAPFAQAIHFGNAQTYLLSEISKNIDILDAEKYRDARVIIKGCGKVDVGFAAYGQLAAKLSPVVKSLMFGEPCSTVPVYKRP